MPSARSCSRPRSQRFRCPPNPSVGWWPDEQGDLVVAAGAVALGDVYGESIVDWFAAIPGRGIAMRVDNGVVVNFSHHDATALAIHHSSRAGTRIVVGTARRRRSPGEPNGWQRTSRESRQGQFSRGSRFRGRRHARHRGGSRERPRRRTHPPGDRGRGAHKLGGGHLRGHWSGARRSPRSLCSRSTPGPSPSSTPPDATS